VLLDVVTLYVVVISSHKATFFHSFELYELYFISVEVHKVQVKNKVHKVRTSQLWFWVLCSTLGDNTLCAGIVRQVCFVVIPAYVTNVFFQTHELA